MGQKENETLFKDVVKSKYGYYELKSKPTEEELASFYANSYYQDDKSVYRKQYTEKELKNKYRRLQRMQHVIEKRIQAEGIGKKFLDVGCGEGFALKYFMEKGYDVLGIEYDVRGCEYHNPEAVKKIRKGSLYDVLGQFAPGSYTGTILMDNVLEHLLDPERLIQMVTAMGRPGGGRTCLIVTVPNDFSATQLRLYENGSIRSPFWVTASSYPPEHISYFDKDSIKKLLEAYGWEMKFIMGSYPIDFNLFAENTNYIRDPKKGRSCYEAMLEIEELIGDMEAGEDMLIDIYGKLGEAGLGRAVTAYFILQ